MKSLNSISTPIACKTCGQPAPVLGAVDFNKNCLETQGMRLPPTHVAVTYHRCAACGLTFTAAFDGWNLDDFRAHIYNADYARVDPEYAEARPRASAASVLNMIGAHRELRLLDYGGGDGGLARLLQAEGIFARSYDPMVDPPPEASERSAYDIVTAIEVFEHTPNPRATAKEALSFLKPDGVLVISTFAPEQPPAEGVAHWYVAPRNGHVTIHTRRSLAGLLATLGCHTHHFSDGAHMAYRALPAWLKE